MKKAITLLFVAAVLFTFLTSAAFAVEGPQVVVEVTDTEVVEGETVVTVAVSVEGNTGFNAYNIKLVHGEGLELETVAAGELVEGKGLFVANDSIGFILMDGQIDEDGVLFTAQFTVAGDCGDEYAVTVEIINMGVSNVEMNPAVVGCEIEVTHTPGEAVKENEVAATCTKEGSYDMVVYCTVCGEELSRETVTVDVVDHTAGEAVIENVVDATCTVAGNYDEVVYCTVCGKELSRKTVTGEKLAHTAGEAVKENEKAATCAKEGSYDEVVYCTVCGEELSRETVTVEKLAHSLIKVDAKDPTCTEAGHKAYEYCSKCDYTTYEEVAATGHMSSDKLGCDKDGHWHICEICGEQIDEKAAHVWDEGVEDGNGWKKITCIICGYAYEEEVPPTGDMGAIVFALVAVSGMGLVALKKKKEN